MKTILVPTDFSANATHALNYAIEFAKHQNAKLILLHAYHIDFANSYVPVNLIEQEVQNAEEESNKKLNVIAAKIRHTHKLACEVVSHQDMAVDAIITLAAEKNIDLIIMGTKGSSGLSGMIFGSNTSRVIEKAPCPVIAVPEGASCKDIKKITYASDYNHSDIEAIEKVVAIAKSYKAQLNVLHITEEMQLTEGEKGKMQKFMEDVQAKVTYNNLSFQIFHSENIEQKLEEYLEEEATDLLIMSTHQRNFSDKIFGKSITRNLAFHITVPMMAFHYKKKESVIIY
jgi:nucleotide-binding universal stress UspA family protein